MAGETTETVLAWSSQQSLAEFLTEGNWMTYEEIDIELAKCLEVGSAEQYRAAIKALANRLTTENEKHYLVDFMRNAKK
jgi:hypothetical protein